jgi:hypothetical protein
LLHPDAAEGDDGPVPKFKRPDARSFSTVPGRSRTTKPRPARQSGLLSGNAQTARRRWAKYQCLSRHIDF